MPRLALSLLGGFRAELGSGRTLSLPSRKAQALLAYLALRRRRITRDALVDLLWADAGADRGRVSLRQALAALRIALPRTRPAILIADHQTVQVSGALVTVDALRFERLAAGKTPRALFEAISVYRGELLDGVRLREARRRFRVTVSLLPLRPGGRPHRPLTPCPESP